MHRRRLFAILIFVFVLAAATSAVRFLFFQSPAEQLGRMQGSLLSAVEKRDWNAIQSMLGDDFVDGFGHDRDSAIKDGKDVFSTYFSLTLKSKVTLVRATSDSGFVKLKIKIEGTGTPVSQMVTSRVNSSDEPWVFHWQKTGRWPWNWKLILLQNEYF